MCFCCGQLSSLTILKKDDLYKNNFFPAHFCKGFLLTKCKRNRGPSARKNVKNHNLKTRMEYSSKSSMTKVDRSKKTCFEICGILKESKTNSKK